MVDELETGIHRVTFALPFGIDHVHCYFLRSSNGGWILVDTGLGSRDPEARWGPVLAELDAPVERIVVTHMHPDHVGGATDVAGADGRAGAARGARTTCSACRRGADAIRSGSRPTGPSTGMPASHVQGLAQESDRLIAAVHWPREPELLEPGDEVDGWRVEVLRGHADGHIVLLRDGVMIAGDVILGGITPAIGLYPNSRPDPLGDYFETLDRIEELAPRVAYSGHKEPVTDPAGRAREIRAHHVERLDHAVGALDGRPLSAYEVSLALFGGELSTTLRRFATAEALAHLERLVYDGPGRACGLGLPQNGDLRGASARERREGRAGRD